MTKALGTHYASALSDAVFAPNSGLSPQDAIQQLRAAVSLITGSKDLEKAMLSPTVSKPRKSAVIARLADSLGLHRLIRNFLLVVISHRRTGELPGMLWEFETKIDERLGWIPADIASARELATGEREEIERALGTKLGKFIRAHYEVDPGLLAGVRARVASMEYDATLRGKLESMRQRLAAHH